ncbi:MAG TPA: type II secretion system protein GspL [Gammaproteobacteria bacterium]|jgi:general secretion pathway protein L
METLFIKLDNKNPDTVQWVVIDEAGNPEATVRQGSLTEAREFVHQRRVVCAIPGTDVYLDHVNLPSSRSRRKLQQAVPFALEDDLAEDLDDLQFALGREQTMTPAETEDGPSQSLINLPVAVINKQRLRAYLDRLAEAGIKPHVMMPDVLAVPYQDNEWSVCIDDKSALVHTRPQAGFACDLENLPFMLEAALNTGDEQKTSPAQIRIWNHNGAAPPLSVDSEIQVDLIEQDTLPVVTLARGYKKDQHINLLQGEFSYRQEYGKLLKPWQLPGALLLTLIVVLFTSNFIEYKRLQSQQTELQQNMVDLYRQAFPDARNIPDPKRQMEDKLKEAGAASSSESPFLKLLNYVGTEISVNPQIKITSLSFNGNRLDVELSVPELATLDALKQKLDQHTDVATELQSASTEGDTVKGHLRISQR